MRARRHSSLSNSDLDSDIESVLFADKAEQLVRRLGEGDFRNELADFPDVVRDKKIYTFAELLPTQEATYNAGQVRRDGDAVIAARQNSVILGLREEEVIFVNKNHSDIVKFALRTDQTYVDIVNRIKTVLGYDSSGESGKCRQQ